MGQLNPFHLPWVPPSCLTCGALLRDEALHERWHEDVTPGTRWDKGRDERFKEEEEEDDGSRRA
jgi:hypothetical protein